MEKQLPERLGDGGGENPADFREAARTEQEGTYQYEELTPIGPIEVRLSLRRIQ
jgi:hypothetical protein